MSNPLSINGDPPRAFSEITHLKFFPTKELLLAGLSDGTMRVYNLLGYCISVLGNEKSGEITSFDVSSCARRILVSYKSPRHQIEVWGKKFVKNFVGHTDTISVVKFGNAKEAISGSMDGKLRIWSLSSSHSYIAITLLTHICDLVISKPDSSELLLGCADGSIRLVDFRKKCILETFNSREEVPITSIALSPDRQSFVSAHKGGALQLWSFSETVPQKGRIEKMGEDIQATFFPSDPNLVLLRYKPQIISLWNVETDQQSHLFGEESEPVNRPIAISSDGLFAFGEGDHVRFMTKEEVLSFVDE